MIETVLIVDDEPLMRDFLKQALSRKGYQVTTAEDGKAAYSELGKHSFDLVITDMQMPHLGGIEVLQRAKELHRNTIVIVMTAFGTIENAVEAMRLGAFTYLLKPYSIDALFATLAKANEHLCLLNENIYLREQRIETRIIAQSAPMKQLMEEAKKIAISNASVLIHGESGTGKEVVAATIHAHSMRAPNPYIRVNCAAVPDTLIESEFFGHEKGSYTGANSKRLGRFELANKGTLLLDEVTEIPIALQPKLLRVLQEQEFERVGGSKPLCVDVRMISTSNRDLKEAIDQKIFREDLYYRLNVIPLHIPPLRDREADIIPLSEYYLEKYAAENGKKRPKLSPTAKKALLAHKWPGNIRELSNLMERLIVLDKGPTIEAKAINF